MKLKLFHQILYLEIILTLPQESGTLLTAGNLTIDNLNSTLTDKALSANQGRILKTFIDNINILLSSDDTTLDTLQEVVDFIKINKSTLSALTIDSIAGLNNALNSKLDKNQNAVSASKLATARTINGVAFDGSANITVSDTTSVKLTGNETVAGIKTFSSSPIVPTPTAVNQAVNKQYVDNIVISPNGSNSYAVAMAIVFGS